MGESAIEEMEKRIQDLTVLVQAQELALRAAMRSLLRESPSASALLEKRYGLVLNGHKRPPAPEAVRANAERLIEGWQIWRRELAN